MWPPSSICRSSSRCAVKLVRRAGTATGSPGRRPPLDLGDGGLDAARDALRLEANAAQLDEAARESVGAERVERALAAHALLVG